MVSAAVWWLVTSCIGWATWPIAACFFRSSQLRGYAYSRALGLLLMAYPVWLLSALKLTPHTAIVTCIAALFLVCAALLGAWRQRFTLVKTVKDNLHTILFIEAIYFIVFSSLCAFKAYSPAVQHTEQPMDLMILTSLMRSPQIPPPDVWLSGYPLSYYYGGYFCLAQVAHLTHTPAAVAYNLGLVSGYATAFVTALGIFLDTIPNTIKSAPHGGLRKSLWALAGAIVLLVASNGAGAVLAFERLFQVAPTAWLRALGGTTAGSTDPWWWWAGRAFTDQNIFGRLPEIISEFPAFSFLLGDLHPHLMSLPYVLLVIGTAVEVTAAAQAAPWWRSAICWLSPLLIGALGWINSWDLPTFGILIPLTYFIYRLRWQTLGQAAKETLSYAVYLLSAILLFIPFYVGLTTQVKGLGTTYYTKTGIGQLLLTFGALLVPLAIYFLRSRTGRLRHLLLIWIGILILPWVLTAVIGSGGRTLLGLGITLQRGPWVILLLSGFCALTVEGLLSKQKTNTEKGIRSLICLLSLLGCALLYIVEFFYIADVFNSRMNTYFKLSYQAWILLVVAAVLAVWQLINFSGKKWVSIFSGLLLILCIYAPLTAASMADAASVPTLDGAAYLNQLAPEEYGAITWLQEHAAPGEIMVEAVSQDYSQGNRVSAFSGLPTLLGWSGHERQWRGSGEIVRERQDTVRTLYTSTDKSQVLELLQDNHINYLYISPREMRSYGFGSERIVWYSSFLQPVYSAGDTTLFQVP